MAWCPGALHGLQRCAWGRLGRPRLKTLNLRLLSSTSTAGWCRRRTPRRRYRRLRASRTGLLWSALTTPTTLLGKYSRSMELLDKISASTLIPLQNLVIQWPLIYRIPWNRKWWHQVWFSLKWLIYIVKKKERWHCDCDQIITRKKKEIPSNKTHTIHGTGIFAYIWLMFCGKCRELYHITTPSIPPNLQHFR